MGRSSGSESHRDPHRDSFTEPLALSERDLTFEEQVAGPMAMDARVFTGRSRRDWREPPWPIVRLQGTTVGSRGRGSTRA